MRRGPLVLLRDGPGDEADRGEAGAQALEIEATVTLDEVDGLPTIVSSAIAAKGRVEGVDAELLEK